MVSVDRFPFSHARGIVTKLSKTKSKRECPKLFLRFLPKLVSGDHCDQFLQCTGSTTKKKSCIKLLGDAGGALANTQKKVHKRWHTIPSRCLSVSSCPGYLFVVSAASFSIRRILGRVILKSSSETTGLDEILMNLPKRHPHTGRRSAPKRQGGVFQIQGYFTLFHQRPGPAGVILNNFQFG